MHDTIKHFLISNFKLDANLKNDEKLFSTGLIDSFGVLELIMFLEENYKINIDTVLHQISEFNTINNIVELINHLLKVK